MAMQSLEIDAPNERARQTDAAQRLRNLSQALCAAPDAGSMERFLVDLCTPAELRALSERWHVAKLLDAGQLSYREINDRTGVSTATIGRVARFLNDEPHQGYRQILGQIGGAQSQALDPKNAK